MQDLIKPAGKSPFGISFGIWVPFPDRVVSCEGRMQNDRVGNVGNVVDALSFTRAKNFENCPQMEIALGWKLSSEKAMHFE